MILTIPMAQFEPPAGDRRWHLVRRLRLLPATEVIYQPPSTFSPCGHVASLPIRFEVEARCGERGEAHVVDWPSASWVETSDPENGLDICHECKGTAR